MVATKVDVGIPDIFIVLFGDFGVGVRDVRDGNVWDDAVKKRRGRTGDR